MTAKENTRSVLVDAKVPVRLKIALLWTAVMFCYVYGDFFALHQPGRLEAMLGGRIPPLGQVSQVVLLGVSASMAIPACMIFLSLVLPVAISRWSNVGLGVLYAAFVALTMPGAWAFYLFFGTIDIVLTLLIVWFAWRWPRQRVSHDCGSSSPSSTRPA